VHARIQFTASEDPFFIEYSQLLRPTYEVPSAFTLSGEVLASEQAYVTVQQMKEVQKGKLWTFLMDGWEDMRRRSQYATMVQQRGRPGILLKIEDMTGRRADGEALVNVAEKGLDAMGVVSSSLVACVTDDPLVHMVWKTFQLVDAKVALISQQADYQGSAPMYSCRTYGGARCTKKKRKHERERGYG
jgi:hypothetical protein